MGGLIMKKIEKIKSKITKIEVSRINIIVDEKYIVIEGTS